MLYQNKIKNIILKKDYFWDCVYFLSMLIILTIIFVLACYWINSIEIPG